MARGKRFSPDYTADDIHGLYQQRKDEGEEARLRELMTTFRALCRLEHSVTIPEQYRAITRTVRTPFVRDMLHRVAASLVVKPPIAHIEPKDEKRKPYREAASIGERWDMAFVERTNKERGTDIQYQKAAALVRDGEAVVKVVHKPDAWANFPQKQLRDEASQVIGEKDATEYLDETDEYKRGADLPIAWREVDRLSMLFEEGEYGDAWALEYGEYPLPYLASRYKMRKDPTDDRLVDPRRLLGGAPRPEGFLSSSAGRSVKVEFMTDREWHVVIDGAEAPGFPQPNPYAPKLNYFRARAIDGESLLYSLLFLVPRIDELLTMKMNWAYLGAYPTPILESVPNALQAMDLPMGDGAQPAKPFKWITGKLLEVPLGKRLTFLLPPPVGKDIDDLIQILRGLIDVAGIPSVFRGAGGADQAGYAINQLMAAAHMAYRIASLSLQRQDEQALEFTHWLVPSVVKQSVYVFGWDEVNPKTGRPTVKAGRAWLGLTDGDSGGANLAPVKLLGPVTVRYRPTLPTDEQARAMIAIQAVNSPKALSSRRHALEKWMEEEDPDSILDEIWVENALEDEPLRSQVIDEALRDAGFATSQANPASKLVDAQGNPLLPPGPGQLNPTPAVPGQAAAGLPAVPGLNMPFRPMPPEEPGIMPGGGGRAPGAFPGQPSGQGPPAV